MFLVAVIVVKLGTITVMRITITIVVASKFAADRIVVGTAQVVITAPSVQLVGPVGIVGTVTPIAAHRNTLIDAITVSVVVTIIVELGPITVISIMIGNVVASKVAVRRIVAGIAQVGVVAHNVQLVSPASTTGRIPLNAIRGNRTVDRRTVGVVVTSIVGMIVTSVRTSTWLTPRPL